jgi:hypothetical protein
LRPRSVNYILSPLWLMTVNYNLSMHRVRRQINLPGPSDRAVINENLLKKPLIQQRRERTSELLSPQLHTPC